MLLLITPFILSDKGERRFLTRLANKAFGGGFTVKDCPTKETKLGDIYTEDSFGNFTILSKIVAPNRRFRVTVDFACMRAQRKDCKPSMDSLYWNVHNVNALQDVETVTKNLLHQTFRLPAREGLINTAREEEIKLYKTCGFGSRRVGDIAVKYTIADVVDATSFVTCGTGQGLIPLKKDSPIQCRIECKGYSSTNRIEGIEHEKIVCCPGQFKIAAKRLDAPGSEFGSFSSDIGVVGDMRIHDGNIIFNVSAGTTIGLEWTLVVRLSGNGFTEGGDDPIQGSGENNIILVNRPNKAEIVDYFKIAVLGGGGVLLFGLVYMILF